MGMWVSRYVVTRECRKDGGKLCKVECDVMEVASLEYNKEGRNKIRVKWGWGSGGRCGGSQGVTQGEGGRLSSKGSHEGLMVSPHAVQVELLLDAV